MSVSPPPLPPQPEKPSTLASIILLCLILGGLAVLGGGGYFVYRKFLAKPDAVPAVLADAKQEAAPMHPEPPAEIKPPTPEAPAQPTVPDSPPPAAPAPMPKPEIAATPERVEVKPSALAPMPANVTEAPVVQAEPMVQAEPIAKVDKPEADPNPPAAPAAPEPDPVVKEEPVQSFDENAPEVAALKAEADRRIDEAPAELYSDSEKQSVRDAIRVAKSLSRVAILQYASGARQLGSSEINRIKKTLLSQEAETLLSDPQAVIFLIGYADSTGTSELNRTISRQRAEGVEAVLKGFKVPNKCYAVGIGSTSLISGKEKSKNRAVEVWVVIP